MPVITAVNDNTQTPGMSANAYQPDQLVAGLANLVLQPVQVGAGVLPRGAILGKTSASAVDVTPGASNVGTGTVGNLACGPSPEVGSYTLKAASPTVFSVADPEGVTLPVATVGVPYVNAEINFTITAGGTPFVAGDTFALLIPGVVGNFVLCVRTASDGSQRPVAILAEAADASGGPVKAGAYFAGEFNVDAIVYDASWTPELLTTTLRSASINLKTSGAGLSAADPM